MPDGIRSEMTPAGQRHLLRPVSNTASGTALFPETAPDPHSLKQHRIREMKPESLRVDASLTNDAAGKELLLTPRR